jgi:hypothetical protein
MSKNTQSNKWSMIKLNDGGVIKPHPGHRTITFITTGHSTIAFTGHNVWTKRNFTLSPTTSSPGGAVLAQLVASTVEIGVAVKLACVEELPPWMT